MTFADTRQALADQLRNDAEWSTYAYPPAIPQPMSVVIEPDDPYIQSVNARVTLAARMRVRVRIYVGLFDNQGNLEQLEHIANKVRQMLLDSVQNVGDLSAPQLTALDTGDLLSVYLPVEILTEWSTS